MSSKTNGLRLFDTATKKIVNFQPSPITKIYTCGITPYDSAHVGHGATYLYYDVLQRRIRDMGFVTQCVRNVTDIDEPLFERARNTGENWKTLGDRETAKFDAVMRSLNLLPSFSEPRATESVPDVLGFIGMLIDSGHAYQSGPGVYFNVSSVANYGALSKLSETEMLRRAAESGGDIEDPRKAAPLDFALWKPSAGDEPSWPSLWGAGRPGWHIECSALALRELGSTIDIHGGGTDLIFPHHECEKAQSEAVTNQQFARLWMHVGMVQLGGEKMSKSLGNLVFIHDLLENHEPAVVRLAVLANHYRHSWEWTQQLLVDATERLSRWRAREGGNEGLEEVRDCLDNDLDTPAALECMDKASGHGGVSAAMALLGIR